MSRTEKPTNAKRTATSSFEDRDGKRLKKVRADHHKPKYKSLMFSTDY